MLTKGDLQAIKQVVKNEVDESLDIKLKPIRKDMRKIKKDVKTLIDHFDKRDVRIQKRVKKIEEHLDFPPQQN